MPLQRTTGNAGIVRAAFLLGAAILLAYANSFRAEATFDSRYILEGDPRIRAMTAENVGRILTENYWWPNVPSTLYRPVTTLSYLVNATFFHRSGVAGFHLVNAGLHWANAVLLYLLLVRLKLRPDAAGLAAAVFALHPIATEAVTNIVGRADELALLGIFAGWYCHLRARDLGAKWPAAWLAALGVCALLAAFAKENGLLLAAILPAQDWLLAPREKGAAGPPAGLKQSWRSYLAVLPAVVIWALVHAHFVAASPIGAEAFTENPIAGASQPAAALTAVKVIGREVGTLLLPRTLSCDYSYNAIPLYGSPSGAAANVAAWGTLIAIGGLLAYAWRVRATRPHFAFGIIVFFLALLPTANLLVPIGSILADRFYYLPLVGFSIIAGLALVAVGERSARLWRARGPAPRLAAWVLPGLVLAGLAVRTLARNADWHDEFALWRSAVSAVPESFKAHKAYARQLFVHDPDGAGLDAAIREAEIGLVILDHPPLPVEWQESTLFADLGEYYRRKGDQLGQSAAAREFYAKAVDVLRRAIAVDAQVSATARQTQLLRGVPVGQIADFGNANPHLQLAAAFLALGQGAAAEQSARHALQLAPFLPAAHEILGDIQRAAGRPQDAAVSYIAALVSQPGGSSPAWGKLYALTPALRLSSPPVARTPAGMTLEVGQPVVRELLNEACVDVWRAAIQARLPAEAETFRRLAIERFGCPAGGFGR